MDRFRSELASSIRTMRLSRKSSITIIGSTTGPGNLASKPSRESRLVPR